MKAINLRTLMIIVITLFTANLFSQNTQDSTDNYYYYTQKMDAIYDSLIENTPDTVKISGLMDYERQKEFWNTRVYNCDTATGDYSKYVEQLKLYNQNPAMLPSGNTSNTWNFVGPKNLSSHNQGIIVSLYIDPNNINNVLAGTNNSGLFKTTNGGQTWVNVTDIIGLPGLGVLDIAVNPNNTSEIYIATGNSFNNYGMGIFKTTDNCNSWQQVLSFDPNDRKLTRKLLIDNENPSIIYALVNKYVYRSKNGGSSWEMIFDQLTIPPNWWDKNKYLIDIEFKPNDHNTLYISSVNIGSNPNPEYSAEIWKTHNAKATNVTWQRIETGLPAYVERYALETDPQNPDKLYIGYTVPGSWDNYNSFYLKEADYPNYTVYEKYHKLNIYNGYYGADLGGLGFWRFEIEISPINPDIMFIGGWYLDVLNLATNQIVKSYHVGSGSNASFHVDQRIFKTAVSGGKTYLFCGNDGGVSKYNYTDDIMESINGQGLDNLQYFGIGSSEVMPGFYIGGTQDNGEIGNGPGNWIRINVEDSYENIIDPVEPNIVYCTNNGGRGKNIQRSTDFGESFNPRYSGIPYPVRKDFGLGDRPFVMSPQDRNTLYIGYHEVYKTTDGGANWQQFTHFHDNGYNVNDAIKAIALTSASPNIIYVGYNGTTWVPSGKSRLFKTTDGGVTWTDITSGIENILHWNGITDIKVSDMNPTEVWVSFGGFQASNGNAINKVLYSTNAGNSWTDITANLPNLPVNCLQTIVIDNDCHIIACNDIGVFLYDDQQNNWINISNGLPPVSVSDIEINYSKSVLRIATFGRGIWESKLPCTLFGNDIHIYTSQVWNRDEILANTLYIEPNNTLEITSNIGITSDAKIIVKPGAKLILNGARLTNACGESWQGIQVWGNTTASQYPDANGNYAQGILIMKNGATIENAVNAVTLWKPDDWSKRGGIIIAGDAHFINNRRSVEFISYQNFHPITHEETNYISSFTNCDFVYDDNYNIPTAIRTHVTMWKVNGVTFRGCTFTNNISSEPNSGYGIYTIDAGYRVTDYCNAQILPCPDADVVRSSFNGLYCGIQSANIEKPLYQISIMNSNFINNGYGIYFSAVNSSVIVKNTFELGTFNGCTNDVGMGIYLDNSKFFAIEDNSFTLPATPPPAYYIGIYTKNTNNASDEIYRNRFDNMIVANDAEGKNWNVDITTGLAYYCNENQNNNWDFYVEPDATGNDGIQKEQGSPDYVAGNTFSSSATGQFINYGAYTLDYFYDNGSTSATPDANKVYRVYLYPVQLQNACPDHYDGGNIRMSATEYQQKETDYNTAVSSYDNAVTQYDAASDSAGKQYWSGKMSYYNMLSSRAAYDIIRSDLADTVSHPDLFKTWMEKLNTYTAAQSMVDYYLQQGDYTTALNKVDSLSYQFTLSGYDSTEYLLYKDFKNMQIAWLTDGRTIFDLTTSEINNLIAIADSSGGIAGAQARGILEFAYDTVYSHVNCPQMPGNSLKSAKFGKNFNADDNGLTVTAKPNPANNTVTFSYTLPKDVSRCILNLFNSNGKQIDKRILNKGRDEIQYDCSHLTEGVYFYSVSTSKETVSGKLMIVR